MRLLSATSVLALVAFISTTQADVHHDGHAQIRGKGPGRHVVHQTRDGHVAHAHVNRNGKVSHVTVAHPRHTQAQLGLKKVKTTVRRRAMLQGREDVFVVQGGSEATAGALFATEPADPAESAESEEQIGLVFVGWAFFNPNAQFWIIIWFPIDIVDGGDQGATPI